MRKGKCKQCGKAIYWIKTPAGKHMPVNMGYKAFWPREGAKGRVVTAGGEVLACDFEGDKYTAQYGHIPHFATCPGPQQRRAKRATTRRTA